MLMPAIIGKNSLTGNPVGGFARPGTPGECSARPAGPPRPFMIMGGTWAGRREVAGPGCREYPAAMHPGPGQLHMMRGFTSDTSVTKQQLKRGTVRRIAGYARPYRRQLAIFLLAAAL